ncbi:ABC transporter C family member 8-like isoform X1 [Panicum miliaceum]|uniref:ABC transporter C family member 8-like isoform X1 n=1 Tax=Panicum miliaceum TaxID=4540 RepID=A0A3L6PF34_PANMI|nr:ABC transporter C family member 8-like isoform X1 [Panicum miliaceum]
MGVTLHKDVLLYLLPDEPLSARPLPRHAIRQWLHTHTHTRHAICGRLAVASPCVLRALIDCANAALLVAYVSARRRRRAGSAGRRSGARGWWQRGLAVAVSACCVAAAVGYGVAGFRDASSGDVAAAAAPYFARALFWIALAASLHVQPDRAAAGVAVLWWALPSLLVTVYNAETLIGGGALDAVEVVAWPVNLLLLLCALGSVLRRSDGHRDGGGLSEPLIGQDGDKAVPTSELYRADLFRQLAFSWLNPLLRLGRSKALDLADIPLIAGEDTAQHASHKFA